MKSFLFSADIKGFTYLKSTFKELKDRNHNVFLLYGDSNHPIHHPPSNLDKFNYDSNFDIDFSKGEYIESLGLNIPFVPDYLILTRDRWSPEQNIIYEFKQRFPQTKIAYVELNANLVQAIEIKMEMISRTKFPQNQIDIFFDHSNNTLQNKKIALDWVGWEKGVVVGNPSWDNITQDEISNCYKKYNIDPNKTQLLVFLEGGINRKKSLECLKNISFKLDRTKYQLYLKPMPGEKDHPLLKQDYNPEFIVDGIDGFIFDQEDMNPISLICEYNIGHIGSANYGGVIFNKQLVNLDLYTGGLEKYNDLEYFLANDPQVRENWKADFWMRIHNIPTQQEFINVIGLDKLNEFKTINETFKSDLNLYSHTYDPDLKFLTNKKKDSHKLSKYYDEFLDNKTSLRIVDYLEEHLDIN
jgi:hypothetical protein